jgi:small subunit ribosomal protein S16
VKRQFTSGVFGAGEKHKKRACKVVRPRLGSPLFFGTFTAQDLQLNVSARQIDDFMAVKIRMKRVGAKNAPVYRIVVADGRSPRDGKFIEELGTYQPLKKSDNFTLDLERAKYWVSKGAQPSETVASFIKKASKAAAVAA